MNNFGLQISDLRSEDENGESKRKNSEICNLKYLKSEIDREVPRA
jgi:hypothetical protein